jgi:hypothetical protein
VAIAAAMVSVNDGGTEQGAVQNRGVCRVYMTGACAGQGNVQDRGGCRIQGGKGHKGAGQGGWGERPIFHILVLPLVIVVIK